MQSRRRVVITGIGAVTPIGITVGGMWDGLRQERSAIRHITRFDPTPYRSHNAAEVRDFDPNDFLERKRAKRLDRFGHFSVACARLALEDARIDLAKENRERIGATMGSALGGVGYAEEQFGVFLKEGIDRVEPTLALNVFVGAASCNVAIEFGLMGPNSTNGMSCASGTIGVGDAFRLIRDDYADAMLCGGVEAPLMPLCFGAFTIIRAMSMRNDDPERASRPFDKGRDGFVMGEGGTVLVLEEYQRAKARGARIYAEVVGYGNSNDAHHMTAPRPDASQAARAMRLALADGHVAPSDVSYVNAHGSSTPLNDPTETAAIRLVFGDHAERLQVSSTKGYYGHALGASGAFEVAISALAIDRGWLPPTLNLEQPGDGCDLDYIPKAGRSTPVDVALSNSFGFGGINAALVLKRAD
jgi:3-oxoacyl-[acyl-carrier-protein] synthase II